MTKKPTPKPSKQQKPSNDQTINQLLDDLAAKKYQKVIVMVGAGISTAAGIPDFRSPETGLYANLQKYNLPYPESVFDISYLRENPEPFYLLAGEMYPTQFKPTKLHEFLKWISDLGCLKRVYTQNIDTLERLAGVPEDLIVEAHGSFASSACIDCKRKADQAKVEKMILKEKKVPKCEECKGLVKPEIVFFGEELPRRFFDLLQTDFDDVDLAIVAGTSLQVGPFNHLPDLVPHQTPRYLFNMEKVGSFGKRKHDKLVLGPLEALDPHLEKYLVKRDKKAEAEVKRTDTSKDEIKSQDTASLRASDLASKIASEVQESEADQDLNEQLDKLKLDK